MNHLQQAKYAVEKATTTGDRDHAMQSTQIAISHALIAIAENLAKAEARAAATDRKVRMADLLERD